MADAEALVPEMATEGETLPDVETQNPMAEVPAAKPPKTASASETDKGMLARQQHAS